MKNNNKFQVIFVLELLLLLSIVLLVLLPISPIDQSIPSRDSGVFLYTGWRITKGEIPYLQIWDHKPPVIYYLNALGISIFPASTWGVWLVEVISLLLATFSAYILFKTVFGFFPAIFVTFLWLFSGFYLLAGGNLTEEYVLPMQFLLFYFFYKSVQKKNMGWYGFFIGGLSGLLFFTRQNAIAIPVAICLTIFFFRIIRKQFQTLIKDILSILAGACLVSGIIVGYFAIMGALPSFWNIAFIYNFDYVDERTVWDSINALAQGLNQLANIGLAQFGMIGWGAAILLMVYNKKIINSEFHLLVISCVMALPFELWMVSLGGRPRIPYFLVLLPVLSFFACFTIWLIFQTISSVVPYYARAIFTLLMVLSLWCVFFADYSELVGTMIKPAPKSDIVKYIQKNSKSTDFVLMWGADTTYNFVTRRGSPSRYVYQTPLYNSKAQAPINEFLTSVNLNKPALIVLSSSDRLSDFRFGFRDNSIGALMDTIKRNYKNSEQIGDWVIYKYTGN